MNNLASILSAWLSTYAIFSQLEVIIIAAEQLLPEQPIL
jgi:hypothetical protein